MPRHWLVSVLFLLLPVSLAHAQQQQPETPAPVKAPRPAVQAAKPKPKPAKPKAVKQPQAAPAAAGDTAHLYETIKTWKVLIHDGPEGRVCFAAANPADMEPKNAKRTPVVLYVTDWQKDGIRNEVSVKLGYVMKAKVPAIATIGAQSFALTPDADKAFVKDPVEERKLVAAMSNGGSMIVKGTSARGTLTTDHYALDGLAEAVKKMAEVCP